MWGTSGQCHRATFEGPRSPGWKATSQGRRGKPGVQGQREQGEKQDRRGAGGSVGSTCALREEALLGPDTHPAGREVLPDGRTDGREPERTVRPDYLPPNPLRRDPGAAGHRGQPRRGRVGPAPPLGGYCALPQPQWSAPPRRARASFPTPNALLRGRCRPLAPASCIRPRRPRPATGPRAPSPPLVFPFARPPHRAFSSGLGAAVYASRPALRSAPYPAPHRPRRPAPPPPRPVGT